MSGQPSGSPTPIRRLSMEGLDEKAVDDLVLDAIAYHLTRPRPPAGSGIDILLEYNKEWAAAMKKSDPNFFVELAKQQTPQYLWIGCSDSRVPANQVVGLAPGEVFVHRNVANVVSRSDLNCLSVMQFAVEHLKVEHIIVCGHYNCGGVMAAYKDLRLGTVDNWIRHVTDVKTKFTSILEAIPEENHISAMCELNAIQQVMNVVDSQLIQDHWRKEGVQKVEVHGWCYGLGDGIVKPLVTISPEDDFPEKIRQAVDGVFQRYCAEGAKLPNKSFSLPAQPQGSLMKKQSRAPEPKRSVVSQALPMVAAAAAAVALTLLVTRKH